MSEQTPFPYLHGFSEQEQKRLRKQAEFAEQVVYRDIDFSEANSILEVGCGVGAQSEILLRRFPKIHLTGIDLNTRQIEAARHYLGGLKHLSGRYKIENMNAESMRFKSQTFDGAFLCWVLEHVPNPVRVLGEVYRVLKPGAKVYVTEVINSSFFLDPYSPNMWKYWMAFNDYQYGGAGDPFVGAKLGNFLTSLGFVDVQTNVITWLFDNRHSIRREQVIAYWQELLLSAADQLIAANYVDSDVVEGMKKELASVQKDPNAVFMYSFMQAQALVL